MAPALDNRIRKIVPRMIVPSCHGTARSDQRTARADSCPKFPFQPVADSLFDPPVIGMIERTLVLVELSPDGHGAVTMN